MFRSCLSAPTPCDPTSDSLSHRFLLQSSSTSLSASESEPDDRRRLIQFGTELLLKPSENHSARSHLASTRSGFSLMLTTTISASPVMCSVNLTDTLWLSEHLVKSLVKSYAGWRSRNFSKRWIEREQRLLRRRFSNLVPRCYIPIHRLGRAQTFW